MADCIEDKINISKTKCRDLPQLPKSMITTPNGFSITPANLATNALLKAALQTAIKADPSERIYKWPMFSNAEDDSEDTVYVQSAFGTRKSRDGNYRFRFFISKALCVHKMMFSHAAVDDGRVIIWDKERRILLTEDSDGNFRGLSIDILNPEKLKINMGDAVTESPIYVALQDNLELDQDGWLFDFPGFKELESLTDVDVAIVEIVDTDNVRVSVKQHCDNTPVSGLDAADFVVTTTAGAAQAPDNVTEPNGDGIYLLTRAANFVDGFVDLDVPANLSLDAYESTGPATLNMP